MVSHSSSLTSIPHRGYHPERTSPPPAWGPRSSSCHCQQTPRSWSVEIKLYTVMKIECRMSNCCCPLVRRDNMTSDWVNDDIQSTKNSQNKLFLSTGHQSKFFFCISIILTVCASDYTPESKKVCHPLHHWSDILSADFTPCVTLILHQSMTVKRQAARPGLGC